MEEKIAAKTNFADTDRLLKKIKIRDFIDSDFKQNNQNPLVKSDKIWIGNCPFCNEEAMSFVVNDNAFWCVCCGRGGNALSYEIEKGLNFEESMEKLAEFCGENPPKIKLGSSTTQRKRIYELNMEAAVFFYKNSFVEQKAIEYIRSQRGISPEVQLEYCIGYAGDDNMEVINFLRSKGYNDWELLNSGLMGYSETYKKFYGTLWNRITMPITTKDGDVAGFSARILPGDDSAAKYKNTRNGMVFNKGSGLFGLSQATKSKKPLVLVEGNIDVISLHQAGIKTAVASLGTALTAEQCDIIKGHNKKAFIAFDNDAAGVKATRKAVNALIACGVDVKVVSIAPYKDIDEACQKESIEEIKARFKNSINGRSWLFQNAKSDDGKRDVVEIANLITNI